MSELSERFALAFDDDCGLCQRFKRKTIRWLRKDVFFIADSAQNPVTKELEKIPINIRLARIQGYSSRKGHLEGYRAISYYLLQLRFGWLLWPGLVFFQLTGLGEKLYDWIARNRSSQGSCPPLKK